MYSFSRYTPFASLNSCSSCPPYNNLARAAQKIPLIFVLQLFREYLFAKALLSDGCVYLLIKNLLPKSGYLVVCFRRRYSVMAVYTCLLRICCLEADISCLFAKALFSDGCVYLLSKNLLPRNGYLVVCLRRRYSVTAVYTCLVRICCLEADISLFVSKTLLSNG
jgi:hypothetical protein